MTKTQMSYESYLLMKIVEALGDDSYDFSCLDAEISELEYLIPAHEEADFKSAKKHLADIFGQMEYRREMASGLKNAEGITRLLQQMTE